MSTNKHFIPTYAKVMLSDFLALADVIRDHCTPIKTQVKILNGEQPADANLSQQQFDDALNGPYAPAIQATINAYAKILKHRVAKTAKEDDSFNDNTEAVSNTIDDHEKEVSKNALDTAQTNLSDALQAYNDQVIKQREQWLQALVHKLNTNQIELTEIEQQELYADEPLSDITNRFTDLKIDLPKLKKHDSFASYFYLKLYLLIHASLSRRHMQNAPLEINKLLKQFKSELDQIRKDEEALNAAQIANIQRAAADL